MIDQNRKLATFPAFFKVAGKKIAIFGNGEEAFAKTRLLANTSGAITVFADAPEPAFAKFLEQKHVTTIMAAYRADQLDGATLAFAATGNAALDAKIVTDARALRIPANAVDQPDYCDFLTPALVNRAPLAIAIGTEGAGPVLAQMIRARIDQILAPSLGPLAQLAEHFRDSVDRHVPRGATRRQFWRHFFSGPVRDEVENRNYRAAQRSVTDLIHNTNKVRGHVWLVGAGPGAVDLLTLRAQRVMMEADVIVHDALVPEAIVDMGRRDAERLSVGKRKGCHSKSQDEINDLLISLARQGKRIVRLKSGDPLIYGRAAEEMAALRQADITYEIVPGITSAFAAAADFELPLTLRGVASSLVFTTGHDLNSKILPDWAKLAVSGATICVYMGRSVAASVAERLIRAGLASDTTVAIVENASRTERTLIHCTLEELPAIEDQTQLNGPVMVIIGDAVAGANFEHSTPLSALVRQSEAA
ncbi:MAG: siroheme synthase CysG [Rhizobiaceae bacterium]|nr:siroheme synthase CysG [Rhizobiaceae bacterium]